MQLEGKTAIITGSTRGIGAVMARTFAARGARVVVSGRNVERGESVAADIRAAGGTATFVRVDVTVEEDVRHLIEETRSTYGGLNVLVNNAAPTDLMAATTCGVHEYSTEDFDAIVQGCLYGTFWCCKYGIEEMLEHGGSVINISSGAAIQASPGVPAYSAAKAAIHGLTRSIAVDYGEAGIRANVIAVGLIKDELTSALFSIPAMATGIVGLQLVPRPGEPSDIAGLAAYLASDESAFMSGQEIRMDGGLTINNPVSRSMVRAATEASAVGAAS